MGYDLHITRKEFWSDEEGPSISFEEWISYAASDKDIENDAINGKHDFLYVNHPIEPIPLWWNEGEVYTKNPDKDTVKKLIEIAKSLSARVVGDDGESYSVWSRFPEPDPEPDPQPEKPKPKSLLSRLFGK